MLRRSFKWQTYPSWTWWYYSKELDSDYGWSDCYFAIGPFQFQWKTYR